MNVREEFKVHSLAAMKTGKSSKRKHRFPVSTVKPHPIAWKLALNLADGDHSKIFVKSETECVVVNNEWQKKALATKYKSSQQSHS